MTYLPLKARSLFVLRNVGPGPFGSKNGSGGRTAASSCTFHDACPASGQPAFTELRGSGLGGSVDMLTTGTDRGSSTACGDTRDADMNEAATSATVTAGSADGVRPGLPRVAAK